MKKNNHQHHLFSVLPADVVQHTSIFCNSNSQLSTMTRPGLWLKEREWIRGLWPVMYTFVSLTASDVDVDVDVKPGFSLMFDV